jgi:hypothetical protein
MGSGTKPAGQHVTPCDYDLREIHQQLEMLVQMAKDYPLECSLGTCDFLFESRNEIQLLIESLTAELPESRDVA